ncbi:AraC family transcriptional regulator [Cohnella hashimotonis]|uniref:AraC family transcriptional regulator n=1 Tax=Cohnella hashimotonis TaxID=2826895 RepID=A0ABT6TR05_9BACL|nr:AraC family transcriptional regulator [Cohnella hashimotonis]MDI4649275.1 AraC family transcriptional regulator [Cohnella hashimotonis]
MEAWMHTVSPFVRAVKVSESAALYGEWIDYDHVFTYVEQGEADFILNGVKYAVKEGDLLLMPSFMPHIIRSASDIPLIQWVCHFDLYYDKERSTWRELGTMTDRQRAVAEKETALASIVPIAHVRPQDRFELKRRLMTMLQVHADGGGPHGSLLLKALCTELLYAFFKCQAEGQGREGKMTRSWVSIEKSLAYINKRYGDPQLDNAGIGAQAGISANHLCALFKDQLKTTVHKYVTHVRIEQAKLRMLESRLTLTQIAEDVGFSGIHPFSRAFKASVGVTPSEFRASGAKRRGSDIAASHFGSKQGEA